MRIARTVCICVLAAAGAAPAAAQETVAAGSAPASAVRVVRERATIWTRNPSMVLAVAPQGTVLRALSKDDRWYEVEVPGSLAGRPEGGVGFILANYVELVPGTPAPPTRAPRPDDSQWDPVGPGSGAGSVTASAPQAQPAFGIRGFATLDYMFFAAHDSFDALFGASSYPFFGGGAQVIFARHFYVSGQYEYFQKTGERVFVSNGEVFPLGIKDKVTIEPFTATFGYRLRSADRFVPYFGGGVGVYQFKETSDFAEGDENVNENYTSYHALAGVEYGAAKWLFAAFEVQYTGVPNSLEAPGVSAEFDEKNLGGLSLQFKVLVGR